MTYVYRARNGSEIERDYQGRAPQRIKSGGLFYAKHRILLGNAVIPEHHRAATYAGPEGAKRHQRQLEQMQHVAKGTKAGKYEPYYGPETPREYKTAFERMLKD